MTPMEALDRRVRVVQERGAVSGPVIYWMSRDQRARDNWALLFAQRMAAQKKVPLAVVFCLVPGFLGATFRHYHFMLEGLRTTESLLEEKGIPLFLLPGKPAETLPAFVKREGVGAVVTDFDPLRIKRGWKKAVVESIPVPTYEVDAHNVVPCWLVSEKQEFAARTIRPKLKKLIPHFLTTFVPLRRHRWSWTGRFPALDWEGLLDGLRADQTVKPVSWLRPGEKRARAALRRFVQRGLSRYGDRRNDPNLEGQSDLSPYLHFGQLSAQRVALEVMAADVPALAKEDFLEELIIRRELSDNFCLHNDHYDTVEGFPSWARRALDCHRQDRREYLYTRQQFERAETHDPLWNAAQVEMVVRGKMHGYLRMYWAKKILEWSTSPEEALGTAIYLNDRYELDGRDPNGYAGIAWSIGGLHDRPWGERPVFGTIRYMSAAGCRKKFDVDTYVRRWLGAAGDTRQAFHGNEPAGNGLE